MATTSSDPDSGAQRALVYQTSARRDIRWWLLLVVGLVFAGAASTVDPRQNCSADGECAPWLVPLALAMGVSAIIGALLQLIINPRRGSHVDVAAGELIWWQGKVRDGRSSDGGRVPLAAIARIRIIRNSDGADDLFLYGHDGGLLPFTGVEVIPWPYDGWAKSLLPFCPGLRIDAE
jgi:hypothetical protein